MSHRLLARERADGPLRPYHHGQLEEHLDGGGMVWLDVRTRDTEEMDELGARFGFDPAAIEDVIDVEQLPKFEVYDDHLFVVLHALTFAADRVDTHEVDCFVRDNLLVTVRSADIVGVDWLWETVQTYPHLAGSTASELFAQLTEVMGRRYLEILDEFELRVDELSDRALAADQSVLAEIQLLRREEATIRRVLRPQRLVINTLRANSQQLLSAQACRTLGDAYDVHNLVVETLTSTRGLLTDTLDTYRGASAEREAKAATILTVYAAILLPLSLITSWYGMNLSNLPGAAERWGWWAVTAVMAAVAIVSWVWFVRAGIIRRSRAGRGTIAHSFATAARAPVKPFTMLWHPGSRVTSSTRSLARGGRNGKRTGRRATRAAEGAAVPEEQSPQPGRDTEPDGV